MRKLLLALIVLVVGMAVPAAAQVGEDPVDWTPHVLDGQVRAIAVVGDTVVVGGDFTTVTNSTGSGNIERWYLFGFSLSSGQVTGLAPYLDAPVYALAAGPNNTVYAGGAFTEVDDQPHRGLAQIDLASGKALPGFTANLGWGDVRTVQTAGSWVYFGGYFESVNGVGRKGLARADQGTGAVDTAWDPKLEAPEIGRVKVEGIAISPGQDRLAAIGAFTRAGSATRVQLGMFDLTGSVPRLADWSTRAFNPRCRKQFDTYLRGVDFAPDGSYLVVVTTGRMSGEDLLCDSAARFETYRTGSVEPTWVNRTGGDSLYAVEITSDAVYVAGHQRWMNNPHGHETRGSGAVDRKGIAAIDPVGGDALDWNPTRKRGVGVRAMVMCAKGLLVGSDTDELGHEYHARIGLLPTD